MPIFIKAMLKVIANSKNTTVIFIDRRFSKKPIEGDVAIELGSTVPTAGSPLSLRGCASRYSGSKVIFVSSLINQVKTGATK
ncbi:MAG: hypothetical protein BRC36_12460 [Cyanobacteria bacterium QH_2_48_84]|nr:MAG: hypothetical protein BRC36_12460 [Cyanobacteria bacterium QH_2_48_84]